MSDYRELDQDEIVMEGDEVLNYNSFWTKHHGYAGKLVKNCKGYVTGQQRTFRRKETTTTLITKPIDFTGCHPEIAEALKKGLSVKCKVWDDVIGEKVYYVYGYTAGSNYPYKVDYGCYKHAKPVTMQRILRPIEETVPLLLQNGWRFNGQDDLYNDDDTITISPSYLQSWAGKELDDDNLPDYLFKKIDE